LGRPAHALSHLELRRSQTLSGRRQVQVDAVLRVAARPLNLVTPGSLRFLRLGHGVLSHHVLSHHVLSQRTPWPRRSSSSHVSWLLLLGLLLGLRWRTRFLRGFGIRPALRLLLPPLRLRRRELPLAASLDRTLVLAVLLPDRSQLGDASPLLLLALPLLLAPHSLTRVEDVVAGVHRVSHHPPGGHGGGGSSIWRRRRCRGAGLLMEPIPVEPLAAGAASWIRPAAAAAAAASPVLEPRLLLSLLLSERLQHPPPVRLRLALDLPGVVPRVLLQLRLALVPSGQRRQRRLVLALLLRETALGTRHAGGTTASLRPQYLRLALPCPRESRRHPRRGLLLLLLLLLLPRHPPTRWRPAHLLLLVRVRALLSALLCEKRLAGLEIQNTPPQRA
jgi:hypothetical protein